MANIVIKSTLNGKFTIISNEFARNPEVTPRAAKVYNYLMSNSEGWETSGDRVAKIIKMSPGSVLEALNDLEKLGYLERKRLHGDGGKFNGMEYHLHAESSTIHQKTMNGQTTDGQTTNGETTDGKVGDIRRPSLKKTNPKENQPKENNPPTPQGDDGMDRFDEFWETYGHKKNRGGAERAWKKAIKHTDPQDIINAAKLFISSQKSLGKHPQYTPYPSTWLNGKRWLDDVETPEELGGFGYDISFDD